MSSHTSTLVHTKNTFEFISASERGLRQIESMELSKLEQIVVNRLSDF